MKKIILFFLTAAQTFNYYSQNPSPAGGKNAISSTTGANHGFDVYFQNAYAQFPAIPKGVLEAVSYTMTRIHHIDSLSNPESCTGIPRVYGVMGMTLNGKNYFRNNLVYISQISGYSQSDIISSPEKNILSFAKAYAYNLLIMGITSSNVEDHLPIMIALSELPDNDVQTNFALNSYLYSVLNFLNSKEFQNEFNFPDYHLNLSGIFGEGNFHVLSAPEVIISGDSIKNKNGNPFKKKSNDFGIIFSSDYGPAIWNAAASCNYSSRGGTSVTAITIHDVEGTYSGCISWFKNCSASVSAHYVLRSSDGQITQMVLESNKAWHVGSENPYTIGFEHEGYRNQTGWYTVPMYTASAGLARDICLSSGYGINPLRTGFQPWMGPTEYNQASIPGTCVRVKGHQHYPNQTHNDPGPNWDWSYFFNKINNTPTITNLTAASGTFYDSGGASGNYSDDENSVWTINPSGSTAVTVSFSSFNVENTWDYLYVYDGPDIWSPLIGYYTGTTSPGTLSSTGGAITFQFRSDCATPGTGWNASWTSSGNAVTPTNLNSVVSGCPNNSVNFSWTNSGTGWYLDVSTDSTFASYNNKNISGLTSTTCPAGFCDYPNCNQTMVLQPNTTYYWRIWNGSSHTFGSSFTTGNCDNIPPTTLAQVNGNWQTQNFTTTFSDSDNVSISQRFFQVLDWDGTEWRGNQAKGFFNDNFDLSINPDWTNNSGTWAISNAYLNQGDEANGNSNIYTPLTQTSTNTYLYHWQMQMGGTGTNRRAGLHFFSDNSTLPNRGNGYFVYFRLDNQKAQIYKVINDVFTLESDSSYNFSANTFYDFKTIYNPSSGKIKIYINGVFVSSWTDPNPFTTGNSFSLRTGNCTADYNDVKVYKARTPSEIITIGNSTSDVRYQNPNPTTPSCRIKSIVIDNAENWSLQATVNVNIDWTAPSNFSLMDGPSADIDTTNLNSELTANWTNSTDTHSDITRYWYSIGTTQGGTDVINWVDNGTNTFITHTGLSLNFGTKYFFTVKSENGAGLFSNNIFSDGQLLVQPAPPPTAGFSVSQNIICSGETVNFQNTSTDATSFYWTFQSGNPASSTSSNPSVAFSSSGTYTVTLIAYSSGNTSDTLIQNISVTVNPTPSASFVANSTSVYQPNATVIFSNTSTNSNSYFWNFGDGITSTLQNPNHTYADTGYYTVTLISSNGLCKADTIELINYIYVGPDPTLTQPVASFFTSGSGYTCEGSPVVFINNSSGATSYQWTFSGGTPPASTSVNPSVTFASSGNYNVTLIATGPGGVDTLQQNVSINIVPKPISDFSANDTIAYLPNAVINFVNLSDNASFYIWNFGDSAFSNLEDPSHIFSDTGYFTVSLVAGNDNCPNDTNVYINYIYVTNPNGVNSNENKNNSIKIFPNPGSGIFHLYLEEFNSLASEKNEIKFVVFNIIGEEISLDFKIMKTTSGGESEYILDFSNHPDGIYYLKIINGKSSENIKFCLLSNQ